MQLNFSYTAEVYTVEVLMASSARWLRAYVCSPKFICNGRPLKPFVADTKYYTTIRTRFFQVSLL